MMQRLVGSIVKHYNVPRGNWEVRDVHMDMFLVRTNLHDISDYPLPKIYNFTRHTIFDKRNLDLVCNPLPYVHTFVTKKFVRDSGDLLKVIVPVHHKVRYEADERLVSFQFNPLTTLMQFCYEGKHVRVWRYDGQNYVSSKNKV